MAAGSVRGVVRLEGCSDRGYRCSCRVCGSNDVMDRGLVE